MVGGKTQPTGERGWNLVERHLTRLVVALYLVFVSFPIASVFIGGRRVEFSLLLASILAYLCLLGFLRSKLVFDRRDLWSAWFWAFIGTAAVSLLMSPYLEEAYVLGGIQIIGMIALLLSSLYLSKCVASEPAGLGFCVRLLVLGVGVVAGIGVWQFVAFNVLDTGFMADFSFVNDLRPPGAGETLWNNPGFIGSVDRVSSVAFEPSHFVETLGVLGGLALLRTGLLGKEWSESLRGVLPLWVVALIFIGFITALSIIGYALLFFTVVSTAVLLIRFEARHLLQLVSAAVVTVAASLGLVAALSDAFVDKLKTIPLIFSAATGGVNNVLTEQVSALALAANLSVTLDNLGGHPFFGVGPGGHPHSYDAQAPDWIRGLTFYGVQKMDGGSLLLRLLSETGTIGTALFLTGWLVVLWRARQAIRRAIAYRHENPSDTHTTLAISVGITASCAALVTVYLVRKGVYYDPPIWVLIGLTAAVPRLLNSAYGRRAEAERSSS